MQQVAERADLPLHLGYASADVAQNLLNIGTIHPRIGFAFADQVQPREADSRGDQMLRGRIVKLARDAPAFFILGPQQLLADLLLFRQGLPLVGEVGGATDDPFGTAGAIADQGGFLAGEPDIPPVGVAHAIFDRDHRGGGAACRTCESARSPAAGRRDGSAPSALRWSCGGCRRRDSRARRKPARSGTGLDSSCGRTRRAGRASFGRCNPAADCSQHHLRSSRTRPCPAIRSSHPSNPGMGVSRNSQRAIPLARATDISSCVGRPDRRQ